MPVRGTAAARPRIAGAIVLAAALMLAWSVPARADHTIEHTRQQIDALDRAIQNSRQATDRYRRSSAQFESVAAAAQARIAEYASQERAARSEAEALALEIAIAEEQLSLTAFQMEQTRSEIAAVDQALAENEAALAQRERIYAEDLRATYRLALVSPLEMLLSSSSLADFATRVQQMSFVSVQDRRLASELRQLRAAAQDQRAAADLKRKELEGLGAQVAAQRDQLAEERTRYESLSATAASARASSEADRQVAAANAASAAQSASAAARESAAFEQQRDEAEARYAQLVAALQGGGAPWGGGKLPVWPMKGPITSYFGPRWGGFHPGIDIAAPFYRPVVAAGAGTVKVVGKPYLAYGDSAEVVIIQHAGNFVTLYGHLDDRVKPPIVRPGQFVQAGETIAYNGSSGFSTGPHLQFSVYLNGKAVDPLPYLP